MQGHLIETAEVRRLKVDGTNWTGAAGATDLTSEEVDTTGYDGVEFIAGFGAIVAGAATSIEVHDSATTGGTFSAIKDSKITVADSDDNKIVRTGILKPVRSFMKFISKRATQNATVDFLIVILYRARKVPITQHSTVLGSEKHVSPAQGTA